MKLPIFVKNLGNVTLTDKEYVAAGGEASIYKLGQTAFKIYHDPKKMIAIKKIEELNRISPTNILKPKDVISDKKTPVGYTMDFVTNTHPICKLFTKSFKESNGLKPDDIARIVKEMQLTIRDVHKDKCLIVDLNELNLLMSSDFKTVYFIDVDSYQTESFKATAIMESIKDRSVKNNEWTECSDWFSFAVIAFQMYIGIHPYKGNHPNYKINEWSRRMDDGVSVFAKGVSLPKVCNSFSVIPDSHLRWMKNVFINGERSVPPLPDEVLIIVPVAPKVVYGDMKDFEVKMMSEYPDSIRFVYVVAGTKYVLTTNDLYKEDKNVLKTNSKVFVCDSGNASKPVICKQQGHELVFYEAGGNPYPSFNAMDSMCKNNCIYSIFNDKMIEFSFREIGGKIINSARTACNTSALSTKMYDGVVFQDLLGKIHITLPYEQGKCLFVHIPELDKCRILEAKADRNICVVLGEESGKYVRYIFVFNEKFSEYEVRKVNDVTYSPVNFATKDNGVCIMAADGDLEIFFKGQVKTIKNSPIDADMKLLNINGEICFVDENKIYSLKSK